MTRGDFFIDTCCACIIIILASDTLQNKLGEKALTFSINTLPTANNLFLVPLSWNVFGCSNLFFLFLQLTSVKLFISCLWSRPWDLTVCVLWATFWWERFWERSSCIMQSRDWTLLQLWSTRFELVFWEFDTYPWVSSKIMNFKIKAVFRVKGKMSQFYSFAIKETYRVKEGSDLSSNEERNSSSGNPKRILTCVWIGQVKASTPLLLCSVTGYDASGWVDDIAAEQNKQCTSIAIGEKEI